MTTCPIKNAIKRLKQITKHPRVQKKTLKGVKGYSLEDLCRHVFKIDYSSKEVQDCIKKLTSVVVGSDTMVFLNRGSLVKFLKDVELPEIIILRDDLILASVILENDNLSELLETLNEKKCHIKPDDMRKQIAERFKDSEEKWIEARANEYISEKMLLHTLIHYGLEPMGAIHTRHRIFQEITGGKELEVWMSIASNPKNKFSISQLNVFEKAQQACSNLLQICEFKTASELIGFFAEIAEKFSEAFKKY